MFEEYHRARKGEHLTLVVEPPIHRDPAMLGLGVTAAASMILAAFLFATAPFPLELEDEIPPIPTYNTLFWGAIWRDDAPPEDTLPPSNEASAGEGVHIQMEDTTRPPAAVHDWGTLYGGWSTILRIPRWSSRATRANRPFRGHCHPADRKNCSRTNNGSVKYRRQV